jgi:NAD(P)-dependent dehydrogenase (short-subunit alcohol dehydrogenase family)
MPLLSDKVCIITGGAGSLGLASAKLFLSEGAKVMLVDLESAGLARAVASLAGPNVDAVAADVSDAAATRGYVERTVARFGAIDVLFSNAGNHGPVTGVTDYPEDVFDRVIAVHVRGAFLACKYALPRMRDGGSIIITSSVVGAMGAPGSVAYVTAKHAQVGLMRTVAKEAAARGIRVNTLHPGHDRQRVPARDRGRHRQDGGRHRRHQAARRHDPAAPPRAAGRDRALGALSRERHGELRHRDDLDGGRRPARVRRGPSLITARWTRGPCARPPASSLPVGRPAPSAPASAVWRSTPIFQVGLSAW